MTSGSVAGQAGSGISPGEAVEAVGAAEADGRARATIASELDRTLFVEAGAGTGKTTQLVGRITELVLTADPERRVPLSSIAAITFTEAAAAELRERIRLDFEARLRDARRGGDHELQARCSDALRDADVAAISTLHSFAHRLLSEFPVEVGIPPRVEVIDEVRSQVAFDERWSRFVDELFADPEVEEFVVRASILGVGLGSSGSPLRTLAQIFDDNWDRFDGLDVSTPTPATIRWSLLEPKVAAVIDAMGWCCEPDDKLLSKLRDQEVTLSRFLDSNSDVDRLRLLTRIAGLRIGSSGVRANWDGRKEEVGELHRDMIDTAEAMKGELANQTLTMLAARIARFTRTSALDRRDEGVLEFHDLLVLARQLLRTSPEARRALADRYRVIMLDEFQDTDPIQIELALLLAGSESERFDGDWRDLVADPGRLFMVGDPKQSIYRFRRADIELFLNVQDRFADGQVSLTRNYRTVAPIIEAINALFTERMPERTKSQAQYEPLSATRQPSPADHRPLVFGGPSEVPAMELREAEAADVAAIIDDIRVHGDRWLIADPDDPSKWRLPALSDITILLPTRTSLAQLTDALDERNLSYRADTGTLVYETQIVRDLLLVLRAIDDPTDEISLVGALRTPLYACGDDDLLRWRLGGGSWDFRGMVPDELQGSVVHEAMDHLKSLADRRWWDEPSQLLLRIVEERRVFAVAAAGRNSRDRWRRVRYLIDQARAFAEAGGGDLRNYLQWTALQGVDGARAHEPMLPEPDDDSVHIMTVHGSKGLEFPITIVSGLTTQIRRGGRRGVDVAWGEVGSVPEVKVRADLRTDKFDLTQDLEAEMDAGEKERLLYVALTRARDHLVISGHHNGKLNKDGSPSALSHGLTISRFADGAGKVLVRRFRVEEQGSLFSLDSRGGPSGTTDGDSSRRDGAHTDAAGSPPIGEAGETGVPAPAPWRRGRKRVLDAASRPRVRSATSIAHELANRDSGPETQPPVVAEGLSGDDTDPWPDSPGEDELPPTTFRRGRAGTAIGSAVHAVLQFVDLTDPDPAEIERLVDAQSWAESVPEHSDTIHRSVQSALAAPIVASCRTARHWKELYVAAPVGDTTIEGYVDLLVERTDGLVVVDYKTDSVHSEAEIEAKLATYSPQGAAYAVAVETATGRPVVDVQFVFTRPSGAVVRQVDDLDELVRRVRAMSRPQSGEQVALH